TGGVHRAHLGGGVATRRDLQLPGSGGQFFDQLVGNRLEDIHALHGQAGLAGVEEAANGNRLARLLDVGVIADDGGVAPTELEGHVLQVRSRLGHHLLPGLSFARESDLAYLGILDQLLAHHRAGPDDHVEYARWESTLVHQLDQADGGKRGRAGGLGDHRVPDREGGSDLVGKQGEREVPGDDRADDAQRTADDHAIRARHGELDVLTSDGARRGEHRVKLDVFDESLGLDLRVAQRLALLAREQRGDL